jgi:hypothetical protein
VAVYLRGSDHDEINLLSKSIRETLPYISSVFAEKITK